MRESGIISPSLNEEDRQFEATLRPQRLADFTGQTKLKEVLSISIEAAKDPQPEVHLRANSRVPYAYVADVLFALQRGGMKKIGFVLGTPGAAGDDVSGVPAG